MSEASDPTRSEAGQTQPGWYPDPTNGQLRWWDGQAWGAYQQGAAPMPAAAPMGAAGAGVTDPRQSAMWAHYAGALAMFITCGGLGWVGPLLVFATSGTKDPYVKDQAAEALNFQITLAIGIYISYVFTIFLIGLFPLAILWVVGIALPIMGGQAASRGEQYRYPFSLRLVKGA